ncbi:hypothetical protein [Candidatus Tokpelaia sp.]|nr:hypothetical protein [Candidatus Tokpelaia sp.]
MDYVTIGKWLFFFFVTVPVLALMLSFFAILEDNIKKRWPWL